MSAIFGPNAQSVEVFLNELKSIRWFTRVGQPCEQDETLVRVNADFLLATHPLVSGADTNEYMHWGSCIPDAESKIERLIFTHGRLDEEAAVRRAIRLPIDTIDEFYLQLTNQFGGYYGETSMYVHELIEPPLRLLHGIALELLVSDLDPELKFFQDLMPYFRAGFWPCGWQEAFPSGKLIVW